MPLFQRIHDRTNSAKTVYILLLCCGLLTLVAMFTHRFFPQKTLVLVPTESHSAYLYLNTVADGRSYTEWLDKDNLHWRCVIESDGNDYTCGFHIEVGGGQGNEGLDLSGFESVAVNLEYHGQERRLRFYLRNYEPGFSDIDNLETAKFNNVLIPVQYINPSLVLQLKEFSVAEWWVRNYQAPREFALPAFDHVVSFGIDLFYPAPVGVHDFRLHSLVFTGPWIHAEHWYGGLLVFWVLVIIATAVFYMFRLRRGFVLGRLRLKQLKQYNSVLMAESEKYKQLSFLDHLTGLLNRRAIEELVAEHFPQGKGHTLGLIILDVDHFKRINDRFGHERGDEVLKQLATLVRENIRQSDYAARWGGEEFLILLPGADTVLATKLAEKLRLLVEQYRFSFSPELVVTFSAGTGSWQGDYSFETCFHRVDQVLYEAKSQGRNQVRAVLPE